ncbi:MAG: AAA family ATPase [Candidatus Gastranaerophilales bacterium]
MQIKKNQNIYLTNNISNTNPKQISSTNFTGNLAQDMFEYGAIELGKHYTNKPINWQTIKKVVQQLKFGENRYIVGVSGRSGCGKSTLCENLTQTRSSSELSHMTSDMYFSDNSSNMKKYGSFLEMLKAGFDFDNPYALNLAQQSNDLEGLKKGISVKIPKYSFDTCTSTPNSTLKEPSKVILNDGIYSLLNSRNIKEKNPINDLGIFIDVSNNELLNRCLARARYSKETLLYLFNKAQAGANKYINPNHADIILNGEIPPEDLTLAVEPLIKALLIKS